jgi:glycosyltransferase involved in cell wall biosynthesis
VVPRHKEDLSVLLESIRTQTYPHIEVIVVDEGKERSAQRNIGIDRATGEYLLFADADWKLTPMLISDCRRLMFYCDALYIPEIIATKGFFGYLRNWERQFYTATPVDVVRFVRRKDCPRFDETMSGPEDSDWDKEVKGFRGTTSVPYYHHDNVSMINYFKKKAYYSKSMVRYAQKHSDDKVLNWKWRCFGVFFEQGKWKRVLRRPDLMILVWLVIFIRGLIYLNEVELGGFNCL